ncbi:hypothetical protein OROMI_014565 [Orobanche minor]
MAVLLTISFEAYSLIQYYILHPHIPEMFLKSLHYPDIKPLISSTKEHPRPDIHSTISSRGRAL